jgi:hypothetical protein
MAFVRTKIRMVWILPPSSSKAADCLDALLTNDWLVLVQNRYRYLDSARQEGV